MTRHHKRRNLSRSIFAFSLLAAMLFQAPLTFACGPFSLTAVFTFRFHPEYPLEDFARGEIGITLPSYARSYLFVAYRYFNGKAFTQTEQQALVELWRERLDLRWESGEEQAVKQWLDARQKIVSGSAPKIEVYRNREKPNEYDSYLNCQNDAFETAATTLEARSIQFGPDSVGVKQWVEAQDEVFANCSEGHHIPVPLPAETDPLFRADREYQIAAANFYASNLDVSKTSFESIAGNSKSPWRATAAYLVGRTLLRKASLGPEEKKKSALEQAETQLNKILRQPELKASHAGAQRLLNIVRNRLHPEDRIHELGKSLVSKNENPGLKQDLWDYTVLLDGFVEESPDPQKPSPPLSNLKEDDLTDWLVTFQSDKPDALEHSLARWQTTSSLPWLIAALSKITPQHEKAALLQAAAAKVPSSSPAFVTVSFQSVRLDILAGRAAEARAKLDGLFSKHRARLTHSAENLLQQQRMLVASDLNDFLSHVARVPAGFSWDEDGREIPADEGDAGEELKALQGKPRFDSETADILDLRMPLALLNQVPGNTALPDHLRRDVAQAVWLRSVLLGNSTTATALAPTLRSLVPELSPFLDQYQTARDPAAKKFAAIYAWLNFPGMQPIVSVGVVRQMPLDQQDSYRDNWWCSAANLALEATEKKSDALGMSATQSIPTFLTASQRAIADKEYASLAAIGPTPNYLCRQVLEWAAKNPGDARVPEALHLAVKATRYGCTDKQTGRWSKAAYDFLHQHYPGNAWTRKTPYWFKD
jgi:hypothetical protein